MSKPLANKNQKLKTALFAILTTLILAGMVVGIGWVLEKYYKKQVYFPGSFVPVFEVIDSLTLSEEVFTDSLGIQRFNKEYYEDHPDFSKAGYVINEDGFRSEPFLTPAERDSAAKTILFLGASYTFGASANPISECFADRIRAQGYTVFNAGMPGADPAQFWAVAREYIPKLKPKLCIMMFTTSNVMYFRRDPRPYVPMDYWTNAGIIHAWKSQYMADSANIPFYTAQEAYDFYVDHYTILGKGRSDLHKLCGKSIVCTLLYRTITGWTDPQLKVRQPEKPISAFYLNKIDSLCRENGTVFQTITIPDMHILQSDIQYYQDNYPGLFGEAPVLVPSHFTIDDYVITESHFNNQGHKKMADFILNFIEKKEIFSMNDSLAVGN